MANDAARKKAKVVELNEYEQKRLHNIERNQEVLKQLGVPEAKRLLEEDVDLNPPDDDVAADAGDPLGPVETQTDKDNQKSHFELMVRSRGVGVINN